MINDSNICLSLFKEKIQLEGMLSTLETSAYRMDGNTKNNLKPMAKYVKMGTPSCCDYLYIKNKKAVLIEDTRLGKKMQEIKLKLKDLISEQQENKLFRAKTILRQENSLKVYGSLLLLCRLSQKHQQVDEELKKIQSYNFWLVLTDEDDIKAIDNQEITNIIDFLKEKLSQSLEGPLQGSKLVKNVRILFPAELQNELQNN